MEVTVDMLDTGVGVRTGYKLTKNLGLVIHWIGVAQSKASVIRKNFASAEYGAHFISDWDTGEIIQCVPEDEVCYHVGATSYTTLKTQLVGSNSPNWYFCGVECCISNSDVIESDYGTAGKYMDLGAPSDVQYTNLVAFCADYLTRHGLTSEDVYLHYDITGKSCHVWFLKDTSRWTQFKADIKRKMEEVIDMTQEELDLFVEAKIKATFEDRLNEVLAEKSAEACNSYIVKEFEEAVEIGITDGTNPEMYATRSQVAVMILRAIKYIKNLFGEE